MSQKSCFIWMFMNILWGFGISSGEVGLLCRVFVLSLPRTDGGSFLFVATVCRGFSFKRSSVLRTSEDFFITFGTTQRPSTVREIIG